VDCCVRRMGGIHRRGAVDVDGLAGVPSSRPWLGVGVASRKRQESGCRQPDSASDPVLVQAALGVPVSESMAGRGLGRAPPPRRCRQDQAEHSPSAGP